MYWRGEGGALLRERRGSGGVVKRPVGLLLECSTYYKRKSGLEIGKCGVQR